MIALVLVGVGLAGMAGVGVYAWWYQRKVKAVLDQWKPIPGTPMFYMSEVPIDPMRLSEAVRLAMAVLDSVPRFRGKVVNALSGKKVYVKAAERWQHDGRQVAGQVDGTFTIIYVGPSLAALPHEGGHIVEQVTFFRTDYDIVEGKGHPTWADVYAALPPYTARFPLPPA